MSKNISIKFIPQLTPACVCMNYKYHTSKYSTLFPWAITRTMIWISDYRINRRKTKKNKKKNKPKHTHKQISIKKQTGCCVTQITLNCCETVFQNSSSIKKTAILFFQKFDTETTLTHCCINLCIRILKSLCQNKH